MTQTIKILQITLPILYGLGAIFYFLHFFKKVSSTGPIASGFLALTTVLHGVYVVSLGIIFSRHPMATIFEFLSFVAMTMAIIYLLLETLHRNRYMGAFVIPAIFLIQLCSSLGLDVSITLVPMLKEVRFALHATTFAAAHSAFFLGMLFAIMLLLFERSLKRKQYGIIFEQLPSLNILMKMTMTTTTVGFIFMSIGLGLGTYVAFHTMTQFHLDPKIILTAVVWLLYGFVISTHYVFRWSDRIVAFCNIAGFVVLVGATMVNHVAVSSWHTFIG